MQLTIQTRPTIAADAAEMLERVTSFFGELQRKLYGVVAREGGKAKDHKTEFCRKHDITARFFNGIANSLQGTMDGVRELLLTDEKETRQKIKTLKSGIYQLKAELGKARSGKTKVGDWRFSKWTDSLAAKKRKLTKQEFRLQSIQSRLWVKVEVEGEDGKIRTATRATKVPGICFGSRKLFKEQYHLKENGHADHEAWRKAFREARSHECFFLGSGDETGGNQSCTLAVGEDGLLQLRIRLPDPILRKDEDKYLVLRGLSFPYDELALRRALREGQALSWLIHRDHKGYRLMVSFARPAPAIHTRKPVLGVIGVDFNADHLAVTETDLNGNLIRMRRFELGDQGCACGQNAAKLSDALQNVVNWSLATGKPIAIEDLDFESKKKQLKQMSPAQARALSGLGYAKYTQLMESKCFRRGIELIKVNPAYTSLIGRIKYAGPMGISTHQAAAGVIARRAQGLVDRLPRWESVKLDYRGSTVCFPLPARKDGVSTRSWATVHKELGKVLRKISTRMAEERRRCEGRTISSGGTVPTAGHKRKLIRKKSGEQIWSYRS